MVSYKTDIIVSLIVFILLIIASSICVLISTIYMTKVRSNMEDYNKSVSGTFSDTLLTNIKWLLVGGFVYSISLILIIIGLIILLGLVLAGAVFASPEIAVGAEASVEAGETESSLSKLAKQGISHITSVDISSLKTLKRINEFLAILGFIIIIFDIVLGLMMGYTIHFYRQSKSITDGITPSTADKPVFDNIIRDFQKAVISTIIPFSFLTIVLIIIIITFIYFSIKIHGITQEETKTK